MEITDRLNDRRRVDFECNSRAAEISQSRDEFDRRIQSELSQLSLEMSNRIELTPRPVKAHKIYFSVLVLSFLAEYVVMSVLPWILPAGSSNTFEAILDSCLLTLIVAPILWFGIVRPIEKLSLSRMLFLTRSMHAQELERQRLRQELHDGIGQQLTSMLLRLRVMENRPDSDNLLQEIREVRSIGGATLEELKRLVSGLHPAILENLGLREAIQKLAREARAATNLSIDLKYQWSDAVCSDPHFETTVYRIVQESLNNAIKHANASQILIELSENAKDSLTLSIYDNGIGFDLQNMNDGTHVGNGLISIRERCMSLHGIAEIRSSPAGTYILATLPKVTSLASKKA